MEAVKLIRIRELARDIIDLLENRQNVPSHFDSYEEYMHYKATQIVKELEARDQTQDRPR